MPHIHTEPNQHDIVVSAYIIRVDGSEPRVLVHMHRKFGKLLQIGGHIELAETPWQALAHELAEESGYTLEELQVLQPDEQPIIASGAVVHPVPILSNTHKVGKDHFHSDYSYAFVAHADPERSVGEGESNDLRWLTLDELEKEVESGTGARDVYAYYAAIVERQLNTYHRIPASTFSTGKPTADSL